MRPLLQSGSTADVWGLTRPIITTASVAVPASTAATTRETPTNNIYVFKKPATFALQQSAPERAATATSQTSVLEALPQQRTPPELPFDHALSNLLCASFYGTLPTQNLREQNNAGASQHSCKAVEAEKCNTKHGRDDSDEEMLQLKKQKVEVDSKLASEVAKASRYLQENEELRKQINEMYKTCSLEKQLTQRENANLRKEMNAMVATMKEKAASNGLLAIQHKNPGAEPTGCQMQNETLRSEIRSLQARNEALQQTIASNDLLTLQNQEEKQQLATLKTENETLRSEIKSLQARNEALQQTIASNDLLSLQNQSQEEKKQLATLEAENRHLETEVKTHKTRAERFYRELSYYENQKIDLEKQKNNFKKDLTVLRAQILDTIDSFEADDDRTPDTSNSNSVYVGCERMSEEPTVQDLPLMKQHLQNRMFTLTGFRNKPQDMQVEVVIDVAPRSEAKNYRKGILESVFRVSGSTGYVKCNVKSCTKTYCIPVASLTKMVQEWIVSMQ
jgi:myosin heavy subunit